MSSVQPVNVSDLNGVEFNPGELIIDDVAGYVGYVRNLCTELGTPKDTPAGYNSFLSFQNEIKSAHISTFEPDIVDANYTFEALDLTGANDPIRNYPMAAYNAFFGNQLFLSYSKYVTPFDLPETGTVKPDRYVTPFDFDDIVMTNNSGSSDEIAFT